MDGKKDSPHAVKGGTETEMDLAFEITRSRSVPHHLSFRRIIEHKHL